MLEVYEEMLRMALAVLAGTLPRRLSDPLGDRLPLSTAALPSALLPMALALGFGLPAFLTYAQEITSVHVDLALELAEKSPEVSTAMPIGLSMFTVFGFALATPQGLRITGSSWVSRDRASSHCVRDQVLRQLTRASG
jgi:hypothetical protein